MDGAGLTVLVSSENRALSGGSGTALVDLVCKYHRGACEELAWL